MAEQKNSIAARVEALAAKVSEPLGVDIWDVKFIKEGALWFLRIYIDRLEGVSLDDCEKVSRAIDPILDEHDFIDIPYYLEVCSPGLGRALTKERHFVKYIGNSIIIKLYKPQNNIKEFTGVLQNYLGDTITLTIDGEEKTFTKSDLSLVKADDDDL